MSRPGDTRTRALGAGLVLVVALAFSWVGAVEPSARAALHLALFALLLVAASLPPGRLRPASDQAFRAALAAFPLGLASALGLLPLSRRAAGWVAPGMLEAFPETPWWTAAQSPELAVFAICGLVLPTSMAVLVVIWGGRRSDVARDVGSALVVGGLAIVVLAVAHAVSGTQDAFGWVETTRTLHGRYFGPLVSPNHVGTALVLALPVALLRALRDPKAAPASVVLVGVTPILLFWTGARGAGAIAVLAAAWTATRVRGWTWGLAFAACFAPVPLLVLQGGDDSVLTLSGRLYIWRDVLGLIRDHWLLGVGAGGFEHGFEPYRTDLLKNAIAHAHSEPLEWVAETGALGGLALVASAVVAARGLPKTLEPDREALLLGIGCVAMHATFDFPLAIPAIGLVAAGVLAAAWERRPGGAQAGRVTARLCVGLAVFNGAAGLYSWHKAAVDEAQETVRHWQEHPDRADRAAVLLETWAPWRGWHDLHHAWQAEREGDVARASRKVDEVVALAPDDDDLLRPAALVLARIERPEAALAVAERAVVRGPADYRNHVALGRIACHVGDPARGSEAYARAFRQDAPIAFVKEAWSCLPVSVYWLGALEDRPAQLVAFGNLWIARADPEEALLAFDQAALADPVRFGDVPSRSLALLAAGRTEQAVATARARAEHSDDPHAERVLGEVLAATGDPAGAIEAWRPIVEAFPGLRARIVRALRAAEGAQPALAEAERLRLLGQADDDVEWEVVEILAAEGRTADCLRASERIAASERARSAARRCGP